MRLRTCGQVLSIAFYLDAAAAQPDRFLTSSMRTTSEVIGRSWGLRREAGTTERRLGVTDMLKCPRRWGLGDRETPVSDAALNLQGEDVEWCGWRRRTRAKKDCSPRLSAVARERSPPPAEGFKAERRHLLCLLPIFSWPFSHMRRLGIKGRRSFTSWTRTFGPHRDLDQPLVREARHQRHKKW